MKALSITLGLCLALAACTTVAVIRNPELNYPATAPASVLVYDRMAPSWPFIILARLEVNATFSWGRGEEMDKIRKAAARTGGDAVIITNVYVDILAYNAGVTNSGVATAQGNTIYWYQRTYPNTYYIERKFLYGYVIKRRSDG